MTINDIAKLANTSRGTVDRVINKRGKVKSEVEERVLNVLHETGYLSNKEKKLFALSNQKIEVGVIIASLNNIFFDQILLGMKNALSAKYRYCGIDLQVFKVKLFNDQEVLDALDKLSLKTKLLVISAAGSERIISKIDALKIPVITVSIDMTCANKIGFVGCDFFNSGALAADMTNLLVEAHAVVGVMIGSYSHQGHRQRLEGFDKNINDSLNVLKPIETFDDDDIGYRRTVDLLKDKKPDIIVYFGGGMIGGLKAIKEAAYRPKVITVDEIPEIIDGLKTGLICASISQHPVSQGKKCIELAYDNLLKHESDEKVIKVANSVILRNSILPY